MSNDETTGTRATTPGSPAAPAPAPTTAVSAPPRRRRTLAVVGAVLGGLVLLGGAFGGGVAVGSAIGDPVPGQFSDQIPDGDMPVPPGQDGGRGAPGSEGGAPGSGSGAESDSDSDTGTGTGTGTAPGAATGGTAS
ncbi:hypothetical protein ELQ92_12755 [Labedella populi]|uniref:Uncharacterized protein n=1 Tax=Labedella populi TaxID=2498850 RepID=A0A3S4DUS4_9MICO|nr:hypothetical protein [Labedella populi]RWZ59679.1 hypothetical protein ELQ92_12755 [Labedella populi]